MTVEEKHRCSNDGSQHLIVQVLRRGQVRSAQGKAAPEREPKGGQDQQGKHPDEEIVIVIQLLDENRRIADGGVDKTGVVEMSRPGHEVKLR